MCTVVGAVAVGPIGRSIGQNRERVVQGVSTLRVLASYGGKILRPLSQKAFVWINLHAASYSNIQHSVLSEVSRQKNAIRIGMCGFHAPGALLFLF